MARIIPTDISIYNTLEAVRDKLRAGMSNKIYQNEHWFVRTWHINDPVEFDVRQLPIAIVKPDNEQRLDQYVQEDTAQHNLTVYFYPRAINRGADGSIPGRQTVAMIDRATRIIREDPTFDSSFYDVQVVGSTFRQPGVVESALLFSSEMKIVAKSRTPWFSTPIPLDYQNRRY